ncbi:MAG TPA: DUF2130 domain-containing protein [Flavipsychrobacter sp.]|nr:DUF2130 domain-containing protein [Flavipsychrobacter sp.]
MSTSIICPNCSHQFEASEAIKQSFEQDARKKMTDEWKRLKDGVAAEKQQIDKLQRDLEQQKQQVEEELKRRLDIEKKAMEEELSQQLKKNLNEEYAEKLKYFENQIDQKNDEIRKAREIEVALMNAQQKLKEHEEEMEMKLQKTVLEEKALLHEKLKKDEEERSKVRDLEYQMKLKEMEKQLEDQRKLAEEMKRKAEQGSMQLQGEIQELALEELLRAAFPFDIVSEVGKGVRGADSILTVRNGFGQECGSIIYESKRTQAFGGDWIEKIKADMRSQGAAIAVIVTQTMPKGMECFGEKDGVWVCSFSEVRALTAVLRDMIIRVAGAVNSNENKGEKMVMLYDYLTSKEFSEQWDAIKEGFVSMRMSIIKEREQMEKMWKAREKHLDKVLLNASRIKGSISGISGMDVNLNLIEEAGENEYVIE